MKKITLILIYYAILFLKLPQKQQKMIYFIRHAESKYNVVEAQIKNKYGQNYMQTAQYQNAKFSKEFLDVQITQKGIEQCMECRQKMKEIDVDLIIVSPLRRALRTCNIVFEGHKSNAPVIVDPAFRQVLCSSNDIGSKVLQSKKQFSNFDFSLITDPDIWYLLNVQDQMIKERLFNNLKQSKNQSKMDAAIDVTLQFLKQHFKARQADPKNQQLLKKVLPSLKRQQQILLQNLKNHRSIAVVSHSQNIKSYVGYKIANCQIYPFTQQRLKNLKTH